MTKYQDDLKEACLEALFHLATVSHVILSEDFDYSHLQGVFNDFESVEFACQAAQSIIRKVVRDQNPSAPPDTPHSRLTDLRRTHRPGG